MTPQRFIDLVCRMLSAQKQYFRTRNYDDLEESKKLVQEVVMALRSISTDANQLSIFNP